jgi:hypothetical protein
MPKFTFTTPDGEVHTLTGPEGTTGKEAWDILQKKLGQEPKGPQYGAGVSAVEGAMTGLSANWRDEIVGASKASGLPGWLGGFRVPIGAARLGYEAYTGKPGPATEAYTKGVEDVRNIHRGMQEQHPYAYGAGEMAGAVGGAVAGGAALRGAGVVKSLPELAGLGARFGRAAAGGATYGAISGAGEGEDAMSRALGAGIGAVTGGVGGVGGQAAGEVVGAAARPVVSRVQGYFNPSGKAAEEAVGGIKSGQAQLARGLESRTMTPGQFGEAKTAGQPAMLADIGGTATRSQIRAAANVSPEARGTLEHAFGEREAGARSRVGEDIRNLVHEGADSFKSKEDLEAAYNASREGAYKKAYAASDRPINSPVLQRLMGSRMVNQAIKEAVETGNDRAIIQGHGGFNSPITITPDGRMVWNKTAGGAPSYPNLQFWDYVKRGLDTKASIAFRAGDKDTGGLAADASKQLRGELDKLVPNIYKEARGVGETYFGRTKMIEAGQDAINFKDDPRALGKIMGKMDDAGKALFREGHAGALADKAEKGGAQAIGKMFEQPKQRKIIEAIHGEKGTDKIQAMLLRENIFKEAQKSLGGSTTARQLIEAGLIGGAKSLPAAGVGAGLEEYSGGDWRLGAITGAVAHGATKKIVAHVDQRVAQKFAELITSNDPELLRAGLDMAANSKKWITRLQAVADRLANIGSVTGGMIGDYVKPAQEKRPQLYEQ